MLHFFRELLTLLLGSSLQKRTNESNDGVSEQVSKVARVGNARDTGEGAVMFHASSDQHDDSLGSGGDRKGSDSDAADEEHCDEQRTEADDSEGSEEPGNDGNDDDGEDGGGDEDCADDNDDDRLQDLDVDDPVLGFIPVTKISALPTYVQSGKLQSTVTTQRVPFGKFVRAAGNASFAPAL
jgi:cobalamin biosynthesis protein CobT